MVTDFELYWYVYHGRTVLSQAAKDKAQAALLETLQTSPLISDKPRIIERLAVYIRDITPDQDTDGDALEEWCNDCNETARFRMPTPSMFACFLTPTTTHFDDRTVGSVVAAIQAEFLSSVNIDTVEGGPDAELCRLRYLLTTFAAKCTYEKSGDVYIHTLLRSKLSAWRATLLPFQCTPYDAISDQFGDDANDVVRPFFETQAGTRMTDTTWKHSRDRDLVHFLSGILKETFDYDDFPVYSNTDIAVGVTTTKPFMFTIDSSILDLGCGTTAGVGEGTKLLCLGDTACLPLDVVRLYFSVCSLRSASNPFQDTLHAFTAPDTLSTESKFHPLIENLKKVGGADL